MSFVSFGFDSVIDNNSRLQNNSAYRYHRPVKFTYILTTLLAT